MSTNYCIFIIHPIPEDEFHLPVLSNDNPVNQRHKGIWIKANAFLLLLKHSQEYLNSPSAVSLVLLLLLDATDLLAELLMLRSQRIVFLLVLLLISSHPGVLFNQLPDTLRHTQRLILQPRCDPIKFARIKHLIQHLAADGEDGILFGNDPLHHADERFLQLDLRHMGRRAPLVAFVFVIAAPDCSPVLVGTVPDLTAIEGAAITAYDTRGKTAFAAVASFQTSAPFQLHLRQIEHLRADDCRMAVLSIILGNLAAVVYYKGFLDVIRAVGLLQDSIALVFFVGQDALNRRRTPPGGFLSGLGSLDLILTEQALAGGTGNS